ncbi:two-component system, NarL family, nitrate/nitrite sensor histidine kinase NarX [Burkholderia sp. GAS332]|nr:two-component system, NarL family, nitrate/nitrite sensor histidine kinase NarX [Burkholderia sp. GAS332]
METKSTSRGFVQVVTGFPLFARLVAGTVIAGGLCGILLIIAALDGRMNATDAGDAGRHPTQWMFDTLQIALALMLAFLMAYMLFAGFRALVVAPSKVFDHIRAGGVNLGDMAPPRAHEIDRLAAVTMRLMGQRTAMQNAKDAAETEFARQSHRAIDALDMLTRASDTLRQIAEGDEFLLAVLEDLADTIDARAVGFWIEESAAAMLGVEGILHTAEMPKVMTLLKMSELMDGKNSGEIHVHEVAECTTFSLAIADSMGRYGVLVLEFPATVVVEALDRRLVQSVAGIVTLAVGGALRNQRKRRMALMEERAAIARDLHDSLAQSLTFLKLQLSQIQSARKLAREENHELDDALSELRLGVDSAYREVRQLLNAFRGTISSGGLHQAFKRVIDDLSSSTRTSIEFDCRLSNEVLSPDEELHVLQILREALTNVIRHASADHARVSISDAGGQFSLSVSDDGRGIPAHPANHTGLSAADGHYGIAIMRERAERLGGKFEIRQSDVFTGGRKGTAVVISFEPRDALRN